MTPKLARERNFLRFIVPPCEIPGLKERRIARRLQGTRLPLYPWQSGKSPASHRIAMALSVLLPLESFENVVGIRIPGLGGGLGGVMRSRARAAQEHDRCIALCHLGL